MLIIYLLATQPQYVAPRAGERSTHSGSHSLPQPKPAKSISPEEIWEAIQIPEIDLADLDHITTFAGTLSSEDQARVERVVDTEHFERWLLSERNWGHWGFRWIRRNQNRPSLWKDMEFLVQGDYNSDNTKSPLSVLCASLASVLPKRGKFISLVFFCGLHLETDRNPGPLAMIRSFIGQLLRQAPSGPVRLSKPVSMQDVRRGNMDELIKLFECLLGQLPRTVTVFCMIDGFGLFEGRQYAEDLYEIIGSVMGLSGDYSWATDAPFKLFLTTSQPPPRHMRTNFREELCYLNMASDPAFRVGAETQLDSLPRTGYRGSY